MMEKLLSQMTLEEKVGQICVPILQKDSVTPEMTAYITELGVGMIRYCPDAEFDNASVVVGKPNRYFMPDETAEFTNLLQSLAQKTKHKIPLIISVDQEGGTRSDINRGGAMVYASHMCFGVADDAELTYQVARATGEEFASMGINMVQAPIVDVFRFQGRQTMKAATFGEDAELVAKHALAMKRGFNDAGIIAMIKHFPGYGSLATDAHKGTAKITKTLSELEDIDLLPFKKLILDGTDGIMAGHVIVECLDKTYPATLSETLINGYLRQRLHYDGIVETDAMRMRAIQDNFGTGPASVLAVAAGNDLVLLRGDENHFAQGYRAILNAAKTGELPSRVIDKAVGRILRLKQKKGLFQNPFVDPGKALETVGCEKHRNLIKKLAEKSVGTLKTHHLPLQANNGKKILVLSPIPQKLEAAMDDAQSPDMLPKAIRALHRPTEWIMLPLAPNAGEIQNAAKAAAAADLIILGTCNAIIYDQQRLLYEAVAATQKPLVHVAMESPCDITVLKGVTDSVFMGGCANDWAIAAADLIFGNKTSGAKLPITMEG